ncbi:MAG: LysR family transcriptional regulator, partial [Burkholderiales bacterium]|nr:LysR family transcriptional regulator [Burkholderiales bacterium]
DRFNAMRIFANIAETRSFTAAADRLRMPRATVSATIQQLEAHLGARLLHRTTRHVQLTHDGAVFLERCQRLLLDMEDAESLFRQDPARLGGKLKVDVPSRIARRIIAPALPDFFRQYPGLEVELGVTDRPVDLLHEGVDCVIRVGSGGNDAGLVARHIGLLPQGNYASPEYIARQGMPQTIEDLEHHVVVNYASPGTGRILDWEYMDAGVCHTIPLRSQVTVNNVEAYITCCLAGLGLIQVPTYDVQHDVDAGRLVEVLPRWRADALPIRALYPHRRHLSQRVRVFVEWVDALLRDLCCTGT